MKLLSNSNLSYAFDDVQSKYVEFLAEFFHAYCV